MSIFKKGKNKRLEKFAHYLAGAVIIMKGIDKAEHFGAHPFVTIFLFLMGGFIIFANFKHHFFEKHFKEFKSVLFFCEGVVLCVISYYYFEEGKKIIPFFYLAAAITYLIVSVIFYRKKIKELKNDEVTPGTEDIAANRDEMIPPLET